MSQRKRRTRLSNPSLTFVSFEKNALHKTLSFTFLSNFCNSQAQCRRLQVGLSFCKTTSIVGSQTWHLWSCSRLFFILTRYWYPYSFYCLLLHIFLKKDYAPETSLKIFFHMQDYIVIPRSFFRHWGQELEPEVHLKDDRRLNLQCRVEPALGDKAHFFTNTSAIKQHYQIDQPAIMKIKYVRRQTFRFSFPSHNPSRRSFQRRSYSPQDFDSEPIWSLHISRSMATARRSDTGNLFLSIKTTISSICYPFCFFAISSQLFKF